MLNGFWEPRKSYIFHLPHEITATSIKCQKANSNYPCLKATVILVYILLQQTKCYTAFPDCYKFTMLFISCFNFQIIVGITEPVYKEQEFITPTTAKKILIRQWFEGKYRNK